MRVVLLRTGSVPVQPHPTVSGSPRVSLSRHDSVSGVFSGERSSLGSPRISLHLDTNRGRDSSSGKRIRRVLSESDVTGGSKLGGAGSLSFPARIPEEEYVSESVDDGLVSLSKGVGIWPESGIPLEDLGFSGGGRKPGVEGDHGAGNGDDRSKIGAYYLEMLKSNPGDPLLLANYGKFLHEVEKDLARAEEYYGRAILASPGNGQVLSSYGKLIWESHRDGERAKSYFDQAVYASPDDCMVMGSYANFMWEVEDDEDGNEESTVLAGASPALVSAF
ncbi:uncharacterized protein LOC132175567 [Corylus avellana]|uniref:uncharacterized protein LOC132175567 n=1 Tax=Corylus avellana TaxID=13451 RepID=UPI001E2159E3|nr:uncharacterized protein LOC132175567 [Corylus avellana]